MASSHGTPPVFNNKVIAWIDHRLPIFSYIEKEYHTFPTPRNFNYFWNFGAIADGDAGADDRHRRRAGDQLHAACDDGLRLGRAHRPRRAAGLADARPAHERRVVLLHRRLHPHLPRHVLRLLQGAARAAVDPGRRHLPADDGDRLHGLRAAVGPDELLGRHRHHQPVLGHPGGRRFDRHLAVGRLRDRQSDAQPLLRAALPAAVRHRGGGGAARHGAARARLEQPARHRSARARRTPCRSIPTTR